MHSQQFKGPSANDIWPSIQNHQAYLTSDIEIKASSLDDLEEKIGRIITNHKLTPKTKGRYADGEFRLNKLNDSCIFNVHYGRDLAIDFTELESDNRFAFVMAPKGAGHLSMGREGYEVTRQQGVVFRSDTHRILHYDEECETLVLIISERKIAELCGKVLGRNIDHVQFDEQFPLESNHGQSWLRLVQYASSELSDPHSLARHLPAAQEQLEQMLMTGFLLSHSNTYSDALHRPQAAAAPFYVKRAEAYIETHFAEPLSLADIAAHASVSARSLQNGFQNFRGMTPMAYLRSVRLQHAHRALLQAEPSGTTVTEIALACGFGHMGEFAALYKRRFGVSPREALLKKLRA